jgi:putative serine protease PepD
MNEEQRPPGGQDGQAPEQQAPESLEGATPVGNDPLAEEPGSASPQSTTLVGDYPPPTGSPFLYPSPPPAQHPSAPTSPLTPSLKDNGLRSLSAAAISAIAAGALVIAMVAALFGGLAGGFLVSRIDGANVLLPAAPAAPAGSAVRPKGSIADIASAVLPSVVTIKVVGPAASGTGSGFVVRQDGYILTNNHVVDTATAKGKITVLFADGQSSEATVIGRDASYDLAVIRVDRRNLPVLVLGASKDVRVGDAVIAVGAPLGLDSTVTSGIVSALNRPVTASGTGASSSSFINAIQTDAAINPGNSGGPLLDMAGRVIGVNSAIARVASSVGTDGQSGSIGVGFAIPSDQIRKTAEQLIASGKATHPVIGVLIDTTYAGAGVRIASAAQNGSAPITKGGPAEKAGLRPGEVIVKLDGRAVTGPDEFVVAIRARSVGDTVEVTVRAGSTQRTVRMTLQAAN